MEAIKKLKQRDSSIELFRIITMLIIVAHHYTVNSGVLSEINHDNILSVNSLFSLLWGWGGKTGINCFVLITGYFMCKSNITLKKFLKLFLEVEFYNIVFCFIFLFTKYEPFSIKELIKAVLPFYGIGAGFTNSYLVFFCFVPFLNILIKAMDEKKHRNLLLVCLITGSVLQTIFIAPNAFTYIGWFMVIYFIGSYIRLYRAEWFSNKKWWTIAAGVTILLSLLSVIAEAIAYYVLKLDVHPWYYYVEDSNKILATVTAVSLFVFFKNLKLKYNPIINTIAASTFGVLLIHSNSDTMRQWLWKDTLNNVGAFHTDMFIVHEICSVVGIYIICTIIDIGRIYLIEKPVFKLIDKASDKELRKH